MDRFIQTNELNKITDGFSVPIRWTYSNTNSYNHPIIQILMKRISIASHDPSPRFQQWFPEKVNNKDTVNYILDNGWNKPRDIVRLLLAAQMIVFIAMILPLHKPHLTPLEKNTQRIALLRFARNCSRYIPAKKLKW